ncbi:MAG: filamentous hemagglutinin, partial [Chitinophagia bacterium]|nr:filamentous hemagglutinin [Chitinophagia bacterium]
VDFSGAVTGDNLTVATSTGTFDDKNVGVAKTVYVSNLTLGGSDAENYTLTKTTAVASANITKANISAITGITAYNKIYDSTTDATLNLGPAVFVGKFSGDTLNVATATGKFVDKNVGTNKTVNISGLTLGGTDAGNYNLVNNTATATANIVAAGISAITSISGITASDKTYDGNTSATLDVSGAIFPGIQGSDVLTVATSTGNFIDKNAGINKVVNITGLTLGGKDAGNYTLLNTTSSTTASISQKTITAISGITANNKVYDSLTTASLSVSGASFSGKITGDTLTVATYAGAFIDKNVGTGKTVNITGLSLGGTDAINYTLASSIASTTANITKANIARITGITANDKVYDSLTTATLNVGSAGFTGIL